LWADYLITREQAVVPLTLRWREEAQNRMPGFYTRGMGDQADSTEQWDSVRTCSIGWSQRFRFPEIRESLKEGEKSPIFPEFPAEFRDFPKIPQNSPPAPRGNFPQIPPRGPGGPKNPLFWGVPRSRISPEFRVHRAAPIFGPIFPENCPRNPRKSLIFSVIYPGNSLDTAS